jgi:hypothetical protein
LPRFDESHPLIGSTSDGEIAQQIIAGVHKDLRLACIDHKFLRILILTRIFHSSVKNAHRVPTFVGVSREGFRPGKLLSQAACDG